MNRTFLIIALSAISLLRARGAEGDLPQFFDALFKEAPVLYRDEANPFIQEFALTGRYEGQYYRTAGTAGEMEDWDHRRIRYGFRARFSHDLELAAQANADGNAGLAYQSLWNAALTWHPADSFIFKIGKIKPRWSWEYFLSSYEAPLLERSLLANQARPQITPGAAIDGSAAGWDWSAGVFSGDWDRDFGHFDTGAFYSASIGCDLHAAFGIDKAHWRFDYMGDDGHDGKTAKGAWDHNFAMILELRQGAWGLVSEAVHASGGPDAARSLMLLPSYDLTTKLQLVMRWQMVRAAGDVLQPAARYERDVPLLPAGGRGDAYDSGFFGVNYLVHGNHLKLMGGIGYSRMEGDARAGRYDDWSLICGVKTYF